MPSFGASRSRASNIYIELSMLGSLSWLGMQWERIVVDLSMDADAIWTMAWWWCIIAPIDAKLTELL